MRVITKIKEMKEYSRKVREEGKAIGFVPTMGALHEGHMSLVKAARKECDIVVMSIFVNPAQFGPGEDYEKYPRETESDIEKAKEGGVDCIFAPAAEEMYPGGYISYVELDGPMTEVLCGKSRPEHFKGVSTVVAKLFNIMSPHKSYFGQKDAQQAAIIKKMVKDLNMDTEVVVMPIIRERDGLAMSSRNSYLSGDERHQALGIYRSLKQAEQFFASGERDPDKIKNGIKKILLGEKDVKIDYVEIVDDETLQPLDLLRDGALIAVAAFVGSTRLIDNIVLGGKDRG
jgi:pantoate--beta-alanine ligase